MLDRFIRILVVIGILPPAAPGISPGMEKADKVLVIKSESKLYLKRNELGELQGPQRRRPAHSLFYKRCGRRHQEIFSGSLPDLEAAGRALGGRAPGLDVDYDLAVQFDALPRVPILMLYNEADEEFPASCSCCSNPAWRSFWMPNTLQCWAGSCLTICGRRRRSSRNNARKTPSRIRHPSGCIPA